MKITELTAIPLQAKLSAPFRFGRVERTTSSNVLLRLATEAGSVGYGEACPVPQLTGETREGVVALLEQRVAPILLGADPLEWRALIGAARAQLFGAPFTAAAVDIALLDLAAKELGVPIHVLLGGAHRRRVELHGSVGWEEDPQRVADSAEAQAQRFEVLKLYAGRGELGEDLARLRAARERVGAGHPFLLDVNGLWSPLQTLRAAPELAELGVVMIEQPVAPADGRGQREVAAALGSEHGIDVTADERIMSPADVQGVARGELARCANVGVSKLGGIVAAFDTAVTARGLGLAVMVGSVVELGVATAAGLQLAAALPELAYPSYLMGPLKYETQITWPRLEPVAAGLEVPTGPGLGVSLDEEALAAMDARSALA